MQDRAGFDAEFLADKTIEMLSVLPGLVIWIWANIYSLSLIEALAYRIRARRAFWLLRLNSEPLLRRIGLDLPEEYLPLVPEHELRWLDDMDVNVDYSAVDRRQEQLVHLLDAAHQVRITSLAGTELYLGVNRANPGLVKPIGYIPLDEKIGGSVHIAIGMNDRFGGRNASNLHQDFVILKPTVLFDETVVLENGKFIV